MQLVLNTRVLPAAERVEQWRSAKRQVLKSDCAVEPRHTADGFEAAMSVMDCGPLQLLEITGTAYRSTRSGDGDPATVSILFQLDGVGSVGAGQRTARLAPGDACIVPPERGTVVDRQTRFRQAMVNLPVDDMDAIAPRWRERTAQTLDNARPGARGAPDLLRFVLAYGRELTDDSRERLAATTVSLLGQLLADGDEAGAAAAPQHSRLATYHRQRIERFILDHLRDPDLNVNAIAQALHLSVRYVHKLFAGQPVMQWTMAQRLRACQRELATRGARSISDLAYAWGFNSPAHFSRLFKKHFGVCPREV